MRSFERWLSATRGRQNFHKQLLPGSPTKMTELKQTRFEYVDKTAGDGVKRRTNKQGNWDKWNGEYIAQY